MRRKGVSPRVFMGQEDGRETEDTRKSTRHLLLPTSLSLSKTLPQRPRKNGEVIIVKKKEKRHPSPLLSPSPLSFSVPLPSPLLSLSLPLFPHFPPITPLPFNTPTTTKTTPITPTALYPFLLHHQTNHFAHDRPGGANGRESGLKVNWRSFRLKGVEGG